MTDNVRRLYPEPPESDPLDSLTATLRDQLDITARLARELERLGYGITDLGDEWAKSESAVLRAAADRLRALLIGRLRT